MRRSRFSEEQIDTSINAHDAFGRESFDAGTSASPAKTVMILA
jgi:hypothetical protein